VKKELTKNGDEYERTRKSKCRGRRFRKHEYRRHLWGIR